MTGPEAGVVAGKPIQHIAGVIVNKVGMAHWEPVYVQGTHQECNMKLEHIVADPTISHIAAMPACHHLNLN